MTLVIFKLQKKVSSPAEDCARALAPVTVGTDRRGPRPEVSEVVGAKAARQGDNGGHALPSTLCFGKRTRSSAGRREFKEFRDFQSRSAFTFPCGRPGRQKRIWHVGCGVLSGVGCSSKFRVGQGLSLSVPVSSPCPGRPAGPRSPKTQSPHEGPFGRHPRNQAWHP